MRELTELREAIDGIDQQIVELFEQRMQVTDEIAEYKFANGKKVFDREREAQKLTALRALAHDDFNRKGVTELFTQIMSMSRKKQYDLLTQRNVKGRLPFIEVPELEKTGVRVVFQGEEGAYSHAAMNAFFGDDVNSLHVKHFREAMELIADGSADYGVLPIENSTAGIVEDNFDLLVDFENYIVAEQVIPVEHVLMGAPGSSLETVRTVTSHPQALAQCEGFLSRHPGWKTEAGANTALAARRIAEEGDVSLAAIGSEFAARRFGLTVLARHINDEERNATRFMIVTNQRIFERGADRISICFQLPHAAGTLYSILSHFTFNDVDMTHIQSRPVAGRSWEYRFFIDFVGNLGDASVKNALRGIREEAINMKILGNYKVRTDRG